jgi:sugar phosphate isomerase/epimerase
MQIAIFADEINRQNPARAIHLAAAWGISHIEVRTLPGGRFPRSDDTELENFHRLVDDAGLEISAVSPGFCKCPVADPTVPTVLAEDLPRACEWALHWGTDLVSCFAFQRDDSSEVPAEIIDHIAEMNAIAAQQGCRLVLENEAACWGATGTEAATIIRQIDDPNLMLCWDPGNSARAGSPRPFPDEYAELRDLIAHVHLKNFDADTSNWALIEEGVVDWPGQLRALMKDSYEGFIVIETHLGDSPSETEVGDRELQGIEANSFRNLEYVRSLLAYD